MPKRGRKPKPKHLKVMDGTDRADRQKGEVPNPGHELKDVPEHLDEYGRWFWIMARESYKSMGIPSADYVSLEKMAVLYSRWRNAEELAPTGGFYICAKTENPKRHPAATESIQCEKELRMLMTANSLNMEGWNRNPVEGDDADDFFKTG